MSGTMTVGVGVGEVRGLAGGDGSGLVGLSGRIVPLTGDTHLALEADPDSPDPWSSSLDWPRALLALQ